MNILKPWAEYLPFRYQGTLMTAARGCDSSPKTWTDSGEVAYSPARRITAYIRWCFMNPADSREVDSQEGAFMMSCPPSPFKPSAFDHLPHHWYGHVMHALEIIGYHHDDPGVRACTLNMYLKMVKALHLNSETKDQLYTRMTEDRIKKGVIVS